MENKILVEFEVTGETYMKHLTEVLNASGYSFTVKRLPFERISIFDVPTKTFRVIITDAPVPETEVEFCKEKDGNWVPIVKEKSPDKISEEQKLIAAARMSAQQIISNPESYAYLCSCYGQDELSEADIIANTGTIFNATFSHIKDLTSKIDGLSVAAKQMQRIVEYIAQDDVLLGIYGNFITDPEEKERYEKNGQINANHVAEVAHEVLDRAITSFKETCGDDGSISTVGELAENMGVSMQELSENTGIPLANKDDTDTSERTEESINIFGERVIIS